MKTLQPTHDKAKQRLAKSMASQELFSAKPDVTDQTRSAGKCLLKC